MKKVLLGLTCMALTTAAFAETKTETPSKTEGSAQLHTYYVIADDGTNYTLSTAPNPDCDQGSASPCEITSQNPMGSLTAPKVQVDAQTHGFTIVRRQPEL